MVPGSTPGPRTTPCGGSSKSTRLSDSHAAISLLGWSSNRRTSPRHGENPGAVPGRSTTSAEKGELEGLPLQKSPHAHCKVERTFLKPCLTAVVSSHRIPQKDTEEKRAGSLRTLAREEEASRAAGRLSTFGMGGARTA